MPIRDVGFEEIAGAVKKIYTEENSFVRPDYIAGLKDALQKEESKLAKHAITVMLDNYGIAEKERVPMCQDTGLPVFFVDVGYDVHLTCDVYQAVNEGVRRAVKEAYLRASVVKSPINRVNTKDNTPAIIHIDFIPGDKVIITGLAKGGGSENKSRLYMLTPNEGKEGIKRVVLETVDIAGPDACPPFIVGVGVGGSFDMAAVLAKKAIMREIGSKNPDPDFAGLEQELLEAVNKLGVGAQGMGGTVTALGVFIEYKPCHIASLPVAINMQCNACRQLKVVI